MTDVEEVLKKFRLRGDTNRIKSKFVRSIFASQVGFFLESIFKKRGHVYLQDLIYSLKDNIPIPTLYKIIDNLEMLGVIEKKPTNKGLCIFPIKNGEKRVLSDFMDVIKKNLNYEGEV